MLDLRSPVASVKITIGLKLSGIHSMSVNASSRVSHLTRREIGCLVLMTGALLSHFHSSAAIRNNPRMNERYWLRVAAEISFSLYSGTGLPFLRAASLRDSHICLCFLLGLME
jgi:hypothetical protein